MHPLPQRAWRDHGRRPGRCSKRCEVMLERRRTRECARSGAVQTCVVWPKATRGCCAGRVRVLQHVDVLVCA